MALIQYAEMENIINGIVAAVSAKAAELNLKDGALAICYNSTMAFSEGCSPVAFDGMKYGEDRMRIYRLSKDGSHIIRDEDGKETYQTFGIVGMKIAAAAKVFHKTNGRCILSSEADENDNIPGRINWGGCVLYPICYNHNHTQDFCAKIYVAVSGGTSEEDEECAWAALEPIRKGLLGCYPNIPSRYNK